MTKNPNFKMDGSGELIFKESYPVNLSFIYVDTQINYANGEKIHNNIKLTLINDGMSVLRRKLYWKI